MDEYIKNLENEMKIRKIDYEYSRLCIEYAKRLLENRIPVIFDREHLALLLGIDYMYINKIMLFSEQFYKSYKLRKKNGGYREISIPNVRLRYIQRWILDNILYKIAVSDNVKGFVPGLSILDNARYHINKNLVITMDIKDFFPTIRFEKVFNIFYYYGYTKELSYCFARICTLDNMLPQGAPTSPYLANIVCNKMDIRINQFCKCINADFTRYADDITISGNKNLGIYIKVVKEIIQDEGFSINNKKTRFMYNNRQQIVTGLNVNNKVTVPKNKVRYLRQQIYYIKKFGVVRHLKRINYDKLNIKEHLYGLAYFINMVDNDKGSNFIRELDQINWES